MRQSERWQLGGQGPKAYEQYLVPVLFAPYATVLVGQAALQPDEWVLDAACGPGIVARTIPPQGVDGGKQFGSHAVFDAQTLMCWRWCHGTLRRMESYPISQMTEDLLHEASGAYRCV